MDENNNADLVVRLESDLEKLQRMGAIEYYLPSDPPGEQFVVGVDGQIFKMDPDQTACFLAGAFTISRVMMTKIAAQSPLAAAFQMPRRS